MSKFFNPMAVDPVGAGVGVWNWREGRKRKVGLG
jgi:hypothetical protein